MPQIYKLCTNQISNADFYHTLFIAIFVKTGERLTQVRKRKNLSQAEVGKMIGINGEAYGRYERDEVRPTIEMALKIAQALNVSLDYLGR